MKCFSIKLAMIPILVSACSINKPEPSAAKQDTIPVHTIITAASTYQPVNSWSGTLLPGREANLGATLPGKVEKFHFAEGDFVHQGDLIVELSGELLTQAEAELEAIQKDFNRVSNLDEKGSITKQEFDHVKAKLEASRAKVEMLRKNTQIVAPFEGVIAEFLVQEGENYFFSPSLEPGYSMNSGIVKLMQLDPLKLDFEVNEKEYGTLVKGQKILFTVSCSKDTFTGIIAHRKPALSTITHTGTVEAIVKNNQHLFTPGMAAHVMAPGSPEQGTWLPSNAVMQRTDAKGYYVYLHQHGKAVNCPVNRKDSDGERILVQGLSDGLEVVTDGSEKLTDGCLIRIQNQ